MAAKTLNVYICFDNDSVLMLEGDSLQQVLNDEEERNAPLRKINVRKAIGLHIERKHLKTPLEVI